MPSKEQDVTKALIEAIEAILPKTSERNSQLVRKALDLVEEQVSGK